MTHILYLTDSAGTHELPPLDVPLTQVKNEKMTTVEPLSGNRYKDYIATKRAWSHTWAFLTIDEYNALDEIYERQKQEWTFPKLTVGGENVTELVVDYELGPKNIISECEVSDVTVVFYETRQLDGGSS